MPLCIELLEDRIHPVVATVINTLNSGAGSLRAAFALNPTEIDFNIPTSDPNYNAATKVFTISPTSSFEQIFVTAVLIDGTTQPGFAAAGHPVIEINGAGAGASADGFDVSVGNSTIKGLAINRFGGSAITIFGSGGNTVSGCIIGLDATGTILRPNGSFAISLQSSNNTIGGTTAAAANVICGSTYGIGIYGASSGAPSNNNSILGNCIGTNPSGTTAFPNDTGILVQGYATGNTIGGVSTGARNIISGNTYAGIWLAGDDPSTSNVSGNIVLGNYIGTNAAGSAALANGTAGIFLQDGATNNTIGGTIAGSRNVISGNSYAGIWISGSSTGISTGTVILGNSIGTNAAGSSAVANGYGITLQGNTASTTIGGNTTASANLISGNSTAGVDLFNAAVTGITVRGNLLGVNAANTTTIPNAIDIHVEGGSIGNTIAGNIQCAGISWTEVTNPFDTIGTMMMLTNGVILAQGGGTTEKWYALAPDSSGSYLCGTWTQVASMHLARLYFGSVVLPSGKVMIYGGEYAAGSTSFLNSGEIYDPIANTWTNIASISGITGFGDDPLALLPNGKVLAGYYLGNATYLYDPAANTWVTGPSKPNNDRTDEETWLKIPGTAGNILCYEIWASGNTVPGKATYYDTATNTWKPTGSVPVALTNTDEDEIGGGIQLPSGLIFQVGANGHFGATSSNTALYDPAANTWSAGPVIPGTYTSDDAPAAIFPDGNVLFTADASTTETTSATQYLPPTKMFEYVPTAGTIAQLVLPSALSAQLDTLPCYSTRMLVLPTGQIAVADSYGDLWLASESGAVNPSWQPTVSSVASNGNNVFTITGTQLNGLSEGATYGDDANMSENYPLVQLTDASGVVSYAPTSGWTSVVATGNTPVSTQFTLPAGLVGGSYSLRVVASGISSAPFAFSDNTLAFVAPAGTHNFTLKTSGSNMVLLDGAVQVASRPLIITSVVSITGGTDNSLAIDYTNFPANVAVSFAGGSGSTAHSLTLTGGTFAGKVFDYAASTGVGSGTITLGGESVAFSSVGAVNDQTTSSGTLAFSLPAGAVGTAQDDATAGNGVSRLTSSGVAHPFANTIFRNPTTSLAVTTAGAGSVVHLLDMDSGFHPASESFTGVAGVAGDLFDVDSASLVAALPSALSIAAATLVFDSGGAATYGGVISGTGLVRCDMGSGTLTLTGTSIHTGATAVSTGSLLVNGSLTSAVSVSTGATLGGSGTVGAVSNSGTINPGAAGTPGTLTTGNLSLGSANLILDLASAASYDSIRAVGTVDITGTTLTLNVGAVGGGDTFKLISVPGNLISVTGTFNGLPSTGSTVTIGGQKFRIDYSGGDGNDVTLTAVTGATLSAITLNGGSPYINSTNFTHQHSMIESIVYTFSSAITLTAANFTLTGINGTMFAPTATPIGSSGNTVWTVTFSGDGVNLTTKSLGDGEYRLALDVGSTSSTYDFFRLLGDLDGNGITDFSDFQSFNSSFNRPTTDPLYIGAADFDGSNTVDFSDFQIFNSNFNHALPAPLPPN